MKKRKDVIRDVIISIRDVIISIIVGTIIALLTCCADKPVKSAKELKAEYLKKEQEEKAIRQEKERIRRGELTYKEAIKHVYEKHSCDNNFSDVCRFYNEGHYYKCFLTVFDRNTQHTHSLSGIVHDPNCPCKQNK